MATITPAVGSSTGGGTSAGAAGGVLSGTYPNPGFAADMATQAELNSAIGTRQPADADLDALAALTDGYPRRVGGAWQARTAAQFRDDIGAGASGATTAGLGLQPLGTSPLGGGGSPAVSSGSQYTVISMSPPAPLDPIAADNTTSDTATIQAHLDWVKATWGGGVVDVSAPGKTVRCGGTSGLVVPAGVQLRSDWTTKLRFPDLTTGSAVTVDDQDFTPLAGLWIEGPGQGSSAVGFDIFGIGQFFYNLRALNFGRGIDVAHSETFINAFIGGSLGSNGVGVYADMDAESASNAGERTVFDHFTIYNSLVGFRATGNGLHLHFTHTSLDFCGRFGEIVNSWVRFTSSHLETQAGTTNGYLFHVSGNAHTYFSNTHVIMGGGNGADLFHLFNPEGGPANFGYGRAMFDGCTIYFIAPDDSQQTQTSDWLIAWGGGVTTQSIYTAYPLKWCAVSVEWATTATYTQPDVADRVRISGIAPDTTGQVTLSAPANAAFRWVRLRF